MNPQSQTHQDLADALAQVSASLEAGAHAAQLDGRLLAMLPEGAQTLADLMSRAALALLASPTFRSH